MKRSTFFRTTALGALGLGLQPSFAAVPFFQGNSAQQWISRLRSALNVKFRMSAKFSPESLSIQVARQSDFLEKHGFIAGNEKICFFGENETFCFYPAVFRHDTSGTTEMLLPVFFRNSEGVWSHQQTLTGFQLEALCRAADALSGRPEPLYALLMPSLNSGGAGSPNTFQTLEGSVGITSKVLEGKVQTRCVVHGRNGLVFDETFVSVHCLS